ncbi:hypothetical protein V494_06614 [Pseudogymnoascus sp. VKM F-4513 (FW-928)]|nr:hypothetical protein V494_06614 [Pseudogymnoascus sp. VKM F-4513 (FW-928)]
MFTTTTTTTTTVATATAVVPATLGEHGLSQVLQIRPPKRGIDGVAKVNKPNCKRPRTLAEIDEKTNDLDEQVLVAGTDYDVESEIILIRTIEVITVDTTVLDVRTAFKEAFAHGRLPLARAVFNLRGLPQGTTGWIDAKRGTPTRS